MTITRAEIPGLLISNVRALMGMVRIVGPEAESSTVVYVLAERATVFVGSETVGSWADAVPRWRAVALEPTEVIILQLPSLSYISASIVEPIDDAYGASDTIGNIPTYASKYGVATFSEAWISLVNLTGVAFHQLSALMYDGTAAIPLTTFNLVGMRPDQIYNGHQSRMSKQGLAVGEDKSWTGVVLTNFFACTAVSQDPERPPLVSERWTLRTAASLTGVYLGLITSTDITPDPVTSVILMSTVVRAVLVGPVSIVGDTSIELIVHVNNLRNNGSHQLYFALWTPSRGQPDGTITANVEQAYARPIRQAVLTPRRN